MSNLFKDQLTSFSKQFGVPTRVVVGILLILPIVIGTMVVTNLAQQSAENRSAAAPRPTLPPDFPIPTTPPFTTIYPPLTSTPVPTSGARITPSRGTPPPPPNETPVPTMTAFPPPNETPVPTMTAFPPPNETPTPTSGSQDCASAYADINGDHKVDQLDLDILLAAFKKYNKKADIFPPSMEGSGDGIIDLRDYSFLVKNLGKSCITYPL